MDRKKILIDTDIGDDTDDALALAFALNSPEIEISAITTVFKNTAQRARLASAQLDLFQAKGIPVYEGAGQPIINEVSVDEIPCQCEGLIYDRYQKRELHGADAIIQTLKQDPDTIIVAIGPLTNLALAVMKAPEVMKKATIYMMGGSFAITDPEWNILCDPEAASVVFRSGAKLRVFGLDVTVPCRISDENMERIRSCRTEQAQFLVRLINAWTEASGYGVTLHDPLTVAAVARPDLVEYEKKEVVIELRGEHTRGAAIIRDSFFGMEIHPNIELAVRVKKDEFIDLFMERVFS